MKQNNGLSLGWLALVCLLAVLLLLASCGRPHPQGPPHLANINLLDRNGMSEIVSSKDRLKRYQNIDFLHPQPYTKVHRTFQPDASGDIFGSVTSYFPNGQIQQELNILNARAQGLYREWYSNGNLKIEAMILGGIADLTPTAEMSWLFEGLSKAWDEEGHLIAEVPYQKGVLEGTGYHYHASGALWKEVPYRKGLKEGEVVSYFADGTLESRVRYLSDLEEGEAVSFWPDSGSASTESFSKGFLNEGTYWNPEGKIVAQVRGGNGLKPLFEKGIVRELRQYSQGAEEGRVEVYDEAGILVRIYHVKDKQMHGEEIVYYPSKAGAKPVAKLSIEWVEGAIQGVTTTWYPDGILESRREMSLNKKNGIASAWYRDGSVMLVEQYELDKLMKGEYFKKGERLSISRIDDGKGIATLFDADGHFVRKVSYRLGKPVD